MKTSRYSEAQIMAILRQGEGGVPVAQLCREHGMSDASFYKWQAKYGGMDASMVGQMKSMEEENRRLKRKHEERSTRGSPWKKRSSVERQGVSIALACRTFGVGETCYRYNRTARYDWLVQYIIESIGEAQEQATQRLWTYNINHPNMGMVSIKPAMKLKFAAYVLRLRPIKDARVPIETDNTSRHFRYRA